MKKIVFILGIVCMPVLADTSSSGQAYLDRFTAYTQWSEDLPAQPDEQFLAFIVEDTPLARKLREKWLYQLARQKDWPTYARYYQDSQDINLQCFAQLANYFQGKTEEAMNATRLLWLSGESQPPACNPLFDFFVKHDNFDENLITERIILALDKRNLPLARYLLKQYKQPRLKDEQLLTAIYQSPARILQLEPGELHEQFYLYGLKRLVSINMDQAIQYWQNPKTKKLLSEPSEQAFLIHLSLYKAMRNHEDAQFWFSRIKPFYYTDTLLDWQIRFALKRQQWKQVEYLIKHSPDKEKPCWQYWLARALEAKGEKKEADEIYYTLAKSRHYYGFLASLRLNQTPNFENEAPVNNMVLLKPYQPIIETIKALYTRKQPLQASRLLNDFISELPKDDKSALISWIANELQWHSKSLYLSNTDELNNQLSLRFPLAYRQAVDVHAKNYQVPPEFIYAIIRQESGFREEVISPAGARGLMQVMPATANQIAKQEKITYADKEQLFASQKNINIGVAYLKHLATRFNRHPVLMAAAYNAGPTQVNYWLKNHPPKQIDIWIETLPWHETRNYLKNVIAFYTVYQFRMQEKPDLRDFMRPL